jgi:hypothetical protein
MRALATILGGLLALGSTTAQAATGAGSTGTQGLKLARGARPAAMGNAYVAVASGADSILWDPAGMNQLRDLQANLGHLAYLDGVADDYLLVARPLYGFGAWGLGMNYLYASDQGYDNWGNPEAAFNVFDFSAQVAMSIDVMDDLSLGAVYKILRQGYAQQYSMGSGADLGIQYRDLWKRLDLAAGVFNAGTPVALGSNYAPLPLTLKVGAALRVTDDWLLALDYENQPYDFINKLHAGTEYAYRVGAVGTFARLGYTLGPEQDQGGLGGLSAGLGLALGAWQLDYAFAPQGDLGNTHRLSMTWSSWLF